MAVTTTPIVHIVDTEANLKGASGLGSGQIGFASDTKRFIANVSGVFWAFAPEYVGLTLQDITGATIVSNVEFQGDGGALTGIVGENITCDTGITGLTASNLSLGLAELKGLINSLTSGGYLPLTGGTLTGTLNNQDIIPVTDLTYNLGSASKKFAVGHISDIRGYVIQASSSAGLSLENNTAGVVALLGAGGGLGVTLYGQLNGVAAQFTGQVTASATSASGSASPMLVSGTFPGYGWNETDQAADEKNWDLQATGKSIRWRSVNDANDSAFEFMRVSRGTGTAITDVTFYSPVRVGTGDAPTGTEVLRMNNSRPWLFEGLGTAGAAQELIMRCNNTSRYFAITSNDRSLNVAKFYTGSDAAGTGSLVSFGSDVVMPKTKGVGIKVDTASPTFAYRDLLGIRVIDTVGATAPTLSAFRGGQCRAYAYGAGDRQQWDYHFDHDVIAGSNPVYIHVHWMHNGTAISGNVVFTLTYTYAKGHNQQAFPVEKSQTITYNTTNIATTPQYNSIINEIQLSDATGTGNYIVGNDIEPDGVLSVDLVVTTLPTITGGSTAEIFISHVDLHYLSSGIGTKAKAPSFYT